MATLNLNDFPIDATQTSGNELADILNRLYNAMETNQSNATRPVDVKTGGIWTKVETGGKLSLMFYTGVQDVVLGSVLGNGETTIGNFVFPLALAFSPLTTYRKGDVIFNATDKTYWAANVNLSPGAYNSANWTKLTDILNDTFRLNAYKKEETYNRSEVDAMFGALGAPKGIIAMWSGPRTSIPTGWFLCDGSNGTPDLRNKFVIGAADKYTVGAIGGTADAVVIDHTHTATSSVNDPGHAHNYLFREGGSNPWWQYNNNSTVSDTNTRTTTPSGTGISVSTSIASSGVTGANLNLPPYYALCYIMKV